MAPEMAVKRLEGPGRGNWLTKAPHCEASAPVVLEAQRRLLCNTIGEYPMNRAVFLRCLQDEPAQDSDWRRRVRV